MTRELQASYFNQAYVSKIYNAWITSQPSLSEQKKKRKEQVSHFYFYSTRDELKIILFT